MNIKPILDSGSVIRYHSTMIDRKQSVAEHSWEVAMILLRIYPECPGDIIMRALTHDCAEAKTGDIPAPIKKAHPEIKNLIKSIEGEYERKVLGLSPIHLTIKEATALKYADILSGIYFTTNRMNCGDKAAIPIRDAWIQYFGEVMPIPIITDNAIKVFEEITE